jgi:hypothetical protein
MAGAVDHEFHMLGPGMPGRGVEYRREMETLFGFVCERGAAVVPASQIESSAFDAAGRDEIGTIPRGVNYQPRGET